MTMRTSCRWRRQPGTMLPRCGLCLQPSSLLHRRQKERRTKTRWTFILSSFSTRYNQKALPLLVVDIFLINFALSSGECYPGLRHSWWLLWLWTEWLERRLHSNRWLSRCADRLVRLDIFYAQPRSHRLGCCIKYCYILLRNQRKYCTTLFNK